MSEGAEGERVRERESEKNALSRQFKQSAPKKKETIEGTKTVRQGLVARSRYPVSVFRAVEKYICVVLSLYILYI